MSASPGQQKYESSRCHSDDFRVDSKVVRWTLASWKVTITLPVEDCCTQPWGSAGSDGQRGFQICRDGANQDETRPVLSWNASLSSQNAHPTIWTQGSGGANILIILTLDKTRLAWRSNLGPISSMPGFWKHLSQTVLFLSGNVPNWAQISTSQLLLFFSQIFSDPWESFAYVDQKYRSIERLDALSICKCKCKCRRN